MCLPCFRRRKRRDYHDYGYASPSSFGLSPNLVSSQAPTLPSYASHPSQPPYQPSYRPQPTHHLTVPTAALPNNLIVANARPASAPFLPTSYPPNQPTTGPTTSPTQQPTVPTFPLRVAPRCRICKSAPQTRSLVGPLNQNNNAGRPFYICVRCKSDPDVPSRPNGKGWITWDDYRGIDPANPHCDCRGEMGVGEGVGGNGFGVVKGAGVVSRQDRAGVNSLAPGKGFWTCATGRCGYVSWRLDGRTRAEAGEWAEGFMPWLV